ncbi:MAG: phosphomannomutase/phosphoglucomutase [Actinomycetes bacterium]|jgi:phosphomannomutase
MFTDESLSQFIKAYDIRGLVDSQLTPDFAFALGSAFARFLEDEREPSTVVIGEDMRPSSPLLATAFADGVTTQGMDVIRIGLASTDMLYFASGKLNLPGVMFTASHNPAAYNGMKLCKSGAKPIGMDSGLARIKSLLIDGVPISNRPIGKKSDKDMLDEYVDFLLSIFPNQDGSTLRKLTIVIDAGNGMAGHTAPAVMKRLNVDVTEMYFELDGTFPNHEANPIEPKNLVDLQKQVKKSKADIGLAFDGDADRCFLIDEKGDLVNPSALTCLIAARELKRKPGSTIIYNLISSKSVAEVVAENGGTSIRSRVGHSFIKKLMAESGAIFGGEHSGHFYFSDFWRADSGMLAALYALTELAEGDRPLSALLAPYNRYVASGELNTQVSDIKAALTDIEVRYRPSYDFDELDGFTVSAEDWWFNVRPSNTEPLLRLNVEAKTAALMKKVRDEVLAVICAH